MRSHSFHQVRWRLRLALVLCVVGAWPDAGSAATVTVGRDAGQPGSLCQFDRLQAAVDSLPNDGTVHLIEVQADRYSRAIDTLRVTDGRRLRIVTAFRSNSGCTQPESQMPALIDTPASTLENGRQLVALGGADIELERIVLADGSNGGILIRDARVVLRNVGVNDQRTPAQASGAAVVVEGGSLVAIDSTFESNHAGANGGALFCARSASGSGDIAIVGSTSLQFNQARHGGAVYLFRACRLSLFDAPLFASNVATVDGGAIATEPAGGEGDGNTVDIVHGGRFVGNVAGSDGGALQIGPSNRLTANVGSHPEFVDNIAGRAGGALMVSGQGVPVSLAGARFANNSAGTEGGAIALRQRRATLLADCSVIEPENEDYCALFRANNVASGAGSARRGGALFVDDGGVLVIDGYAFRDSRGPRSLNGDSGGLVAWLGTGSLHLANALVFDSGPGLESDSHLFMVQRDGNATFVFNTMVDAPGGSAITIRQGATVRMAGNIIAGNFAGVVNAGGTLTGTCNNVQLGTAPAPVDPGFLTTPHGRYRLSPDSAMRNGALGCDPARLPPGFRAPSVDLLGRARIESGEEPMAIDLGAIEFRSRDDHIFSNGLESSPR